MKLASRMLLLMGMTIGVMQATETSMPQNSFRGVPYGSTIAEISAKGWDLTPVNDANGEKSQFQAYIRNNEKKSLGEITCQEITYYFLHGKFYGVLLETADGTQTEILKQAITSGRGKPLQSIGGEVWIGSKSSVILRINEVNGEGAFLIFDNSLQGDYENYVRDSGGAVSKEL